MNEQTRTSHGSLLFALLFFAIALFLLSQLGDQAKFSSKGKLFAQPAFWPGVGVICMVLFSGLHLLLTWRRHFYDRNTASSNTSSSDTTSSNASKNNASKSDTSNTLLSAELTEGGRWLLSLEYLAWFMVYVQITPIIGYLASTIMFMVALTLRAGYRDRRMFIAAAAVGFAIVLVFKAFLGVKIPGGAVYESLPGALRTFMIVNF